MRRFTAFLSLVLAACACNVARADWLSDANARIEQYRKAALTVNVVDASGKPIKNASVDVHETRSAFNWGTAVASDYFSATSTDPDKVKYRNEITSLFNQAELENGGKWLQWEDPTQRSKSLSTTNWFINNGLRSST